MRRGRSVPLIVVVYLVAGGVVAGSHHYFDSLGSIGALLSALLAILLWPLVLFGTKITINT